jgi:hypothetical protein
MTITLQAIEKEYARIGAMIAGFRKRAQQRDYRVDAVTVPLAAGERFAGVILKDDGTLSHYLILLPGNAEDLNWNDACKWASEQGGDLPTRREQSLLFANLRQEFDERYYWSSDRPEENAGWAWYQTFHRGSQYYAHQDYEFRARAVRRFVPPEA